jgi:hypothetical protein
MKYRMSPEPKPIQLGFSPVDSGADAGGPHGFGLTCHPYLQIFDHAQKQRKLIQQN